MCQFFRPGTFSRDVTQTFLSVALPLGNAESLFSVANLIFSVVGTIFSIVDGIFSVAEIPHSVVNTLYFVADALFSLVFKYPALRQPHTFPQTACFASLKYHSAPPIPRIPSFSLHLSSPERSFASSITYFPPNWPNRTMTNAL